MRTITAQICFGCVLKYSDLCFCVLKCFYLLFHSFPSCDRYLYFKNDLQRQRRTLVLNLHHNESFRVIILLF